MRSVRSSSFGAPRSHPGRGQGHNGIDLTAPSRYRVKAIDDGVIDRVYWSNAGGGHIVNLRLDDGRLPRYMHLDGDGLPEKGQRVHKGEEIATQGATGNALDEHLHFEIWEDGRPIDPWPLLVDFQYEVDGIGGLATIRKWSLGPHTRFVQGLLSGQGWTLLIDGDYGPITERTVRRFQNAKGLIVDGIVGPNTWGALIPERIEY